jgi:hypothetical protein
MGDQKQQVFDVTATIAPLAQRRMETRNFI